MASLFIMLIGCSDNESPEPQFATEQQFNAIESDLEAALSRIESLESRPQHGQRIEAMDARLSQVENTASEFPQIAARQAIAVFQEMRALEATQAQLAYEEARVKGREAAIERLRKTDPEGYEYLQRFNEKVKRDGIESLPTFVLQEVALRLGAYTDIPIDELNRRRADEEEQP